MAAAKVNVATIELGSRFMGVVIPSASALIWVRAVDLSAFEIGRRMTFLATSAKMMLRTFTAMRFVMATDPFLASCSRLVRAIQVIARFVLTIRPKKPRAIAAISPPVLKAWAESEEVR